jgi:hypothetical protein
MAEKSMRNRIAETLMGLLQPAPPPRLDNRKALIQSGIPLDDFRMPGDTPYREDIPGMQEQVDRQLQRPMIGPEIDPRLEPPVRGMLGVTPPNDRMVVDPDELPAERRYSSFRYRA